MTDIFYVSSPKSKVQSQCEVSAETKRSLSLSSFLSSESRSNAVPELVEGPSIDYAESQKKYSRAQFGLCRGATKDMKVPESFFYIYPTATIA